MPVTLADWPRPKFEPGGGPAFLFFVVFGDFGELPPPSGSKYRLNDVPVDVMQLTAAEHGDYLRSFLEGQRWDQLTERNPALAEQIAAAPEAYALRGEVADSETLNDLRNVVGYLTYLLDHGGFALYDVFQIRWWTPQEWREQIFAAEAPVPRRHVVTLLSPEDDGNGTWYHTRGMLKFGRPDLSLHNVTDDSQEAAVDLFNRLIEFHAAGGIVPDGKRLRTPYFPDGVIARLEGDMEDLDFNNAHLELTPE